MQPTPHRDQRVGPYQIERELGRGGMGVVWEARHVELGRRVALKMIIALDPTLLERFQVEARSLAQVRHPGIVALHEVGELNGRPWLALELVEGTTLSRRLKQEGPLPIAETVELVRELAETVAFVHGLGILHRDLKPDNVLVDGAGRIRLTDFGLARGGTGDEGERERLTRTGETLGTPGYMPPEQIDNPKGADTRADVYGLGAVLYALLTGQQPFRRPTVVNTMLAVLNDPPIPPRSLRPDVPAGLEVICLRCLAKAPDDRYPSAQALADALGDWAAQGTSSTPRALGVALASLGVVAAVGFGVVATQRDPTPQARTAQASDTTAPGPSSEPTPALPADPCRAVADAHQLALRAVRDQRWKQLEQPASVLLQHQRGDLLVQVLREGEPADLRQLERLEQLRGQARKAIARAPIRTLRRLLGADSASPNRIDQLLRDARTNPAAFRLGLWWRSLRARQARRYAEAIRDADALLGRFPFVPDGYDLRAHARRRSGQRGAAIRDLQRAIELAHARRNPWAIEWEASLAGWLVEEERFSEAKAICDRVLKGKLERRWMALRTRGRAQLGLGKPREAVLDFKAALRFPIRAEYLPGVLCGLALAHLQAGAKREALDAFTRAEKSDANQADVKNLRRRFAALRAELGR